MFKKYLKGLEPYEKNPNTIHLHALEYINNVRFSLLKVDPFAKFSMISVNGTMFSDSFESLMEMIDHISTDIKNLKFCLPIFPEKYEDACNVFESMKDDLFFKDSNMLEGILNYSKEPITKDNFKSLIYIENKSRSLFIRIDAYSLFFKNETDKNDNDKKYKAVIVIYAIVHALEKFKYDITHEQENY